MNLKDDVQKNRFKYDNKIKEYIDLFKKYINDDL